MSAEPQDGDIELHKTNIIWLDSRVFAGGEYCCSRVRVGAPFVGRTLFRRQFRPAATRPPVHPGNGLRAGHCGYYRDGKPGE